MNNPTRTIPWTIVIGLLLVMFTLAAVFILSGIGSRGATAKLPVLGQVNDFTLTNQNGAVVTLQDLRGHVWVADIIFTRCPGPCLRMTRQMKEIETALGPGSDVKLVTLTTDPDFDTPAVLKRYAEQFEADPKRWMFLTGSKSQIAAAAIEGLKLAAVEKTPEERESADDLFIHSTIFVVVDKQGQLRGIYETGGEGVDWNASKSELLNAVRRLERER